MLKVLVTIRLGQQGGNDSYDFVHLTLMLAFDPAQGTFLITATSRSFPVGVFPTPLLTAALSQKVPGFPGIPFLTPSQPTLPM